MDQPLLSICIPTYNRVGLLKLTLDSVFNQFSDPSLKDAVEVVVSDNASPDGTQELVSEYEKKFPQLKYFRNPENLGADRNIVNSVVKATGKYGWYLGDDDALAPGIIQYVLELLKKYQPAVLCIKSADLLPPNQVPGPEFQIIPKEPIVLTDFRQYMEKGYCLGILSVLLFDRNLWLRVDRSKFHPLWECYEIILKLMSEAKGRNLVYIDQPGVLTGTGYAWIKNGGELFTFLDWKAVLNSLAGFGYNPAWIQNEQKNYPKKMLLILLRAKGHDLPMATKNLRRIYKSFPESPFYLFLATILFYIPNFAVKFIRDIKKFFSR